MVTRGKGWEVGKGKADQTFGDRRDVTWVAGTQCNAQMTGLEMCT